MNKNSKYEMAVWRAKDTPEKKKEVIINTVNKGLSSLNGFVNRSIYQSIDDPLLMFDWVEWDTIDNAQAAAKEMMLVPELKNFVGLIEKTVLFEHFSIFDYHEINSGKGKVVELVAYQLQQDSDIKAFTSAYSEGLKNAQGYRNRHILKNRNGINEWAELVFWNSAEDAKKASKLMQANPEIGKVFGMVKEIKLVPQYFTIFE